MKNNPKLKWAFLAWFVLMLAILGATAPEDRPIRIDYADSRMPENEELYFKNLRSFYYQVEERKDAGFLLYRLKVNNTDTTALNFQFAIVQNWRQDEAYIMLEGTNIPTQPDTLLLAVANSTKHDTLSITRWNTIDHYFFAAHLYMALRDDQNTFKLRVKNSWVPALADGENRLNIKTTLKDYFKLVGKMP